MPSRKLPSHRGVYALGDERSRVKIGVSNDVQKRKTDLQTGSADNLRVIHVENVERPIAPAVERGAHKILTDNGKARVREWFTGVSDDEARAGIQTSHVNERGRNRSLFDWAEERRK
jgi:T5orf172 domain